MAYFEFSCTDSSPDCTPAGVAFTASNTIKVFRDTEDGTQLTENTHYTVDVDTNTVSITENIDGTKTFVIELL